MEKFAAVFKKVQKINKAIIGAVLLLMIGVVFLQTFCRFVIFKFLRPCQALKYNKSAKGRRNFPDICLWH